MPFQWFKWNKMYTTCDKVLLMTTAWISVRPVRQTTRLRLSPVVLPRFRKSYNVGSLCPEWQVIFFSTATHTQRISASHFLVGHRYASTWGCYTIHTALWLLCANSTMTAEVRTGPRLQNATSPRSCVGIWGIRLRFPHMLSVRFYGIFCAFGGGGCRKNTVHAGPCIIFPKAQFKIIFGVRLWVDTLNDLHYERHKHHEPSTASVYSTVTHCVFVCLFVCK